MMDRKLHCERRQRGGMHGDIGSQRIDLRYVRAPRHGPVKVAVPEVLGQETGQPTFVENASGDDGDVVASQIGISVSSGSLPKMCRIVCRGCTLVPTKGRGPDHTRRAAPTTCSLRAYARAVSTTLTPRSRAVWRERTASASSTGSNQPGEAH